ncbi:RagB/SusD family nutrient uptake outer membrane protein [Flavivirga rizhaonensis]|uniref:RagB/SusD family nutrient uptake outer membrane protein n=1 Tax=Flavivirga rizhaonensis TaxID=2559571 RepID=A0A4S1DUS3_9FLAO|nr:RagB/SusD family nutrient uptake outer membrane protein [Flavivirga rizhaonensis]TGV01851.1 RagB/SusD family nutrient uptake outer membrane protein [Flavivirga rizhaonensis]
MKKIIVLSTILTLTLVIGSCTDESFITEKPTTFANPDLLLTDIKSAELYLNGAYDLTRDNLSHGSQNSLGGTGLANHWGIYGTDELVPFVWERVYGEFHQHIISPQAPTIYSHWSKTYKAINQCNSVIGRVGNMPDAAIDPDQRNRVIAEAKFLRSALYFWAVQVWENIPLVVEETTDLDNIEVEQTTPDKIYEQVIKDLQEAITVLEVGQGGGRATKGAAQALLGKVYLQMTGYPINDASNFALAEVQLQEVIDSSIYNLLEEYNWVFDLDHEQSEEIVFAWGMDGPGLQSGGQLSSFAGPAGSLENGAGWGSHFVNPETEAAYERQDIRRWNNIAYHNANDYTPEEAFSDDPDVVRTTNPANMYGWKWHAEKPNNYTSDTPFDNPFIRYADVLLSYAEALHGQGKLTVAVWEQTVNRLRARVNATPVDFASLSNEEITDAILNERRLEGFLEGWRKADLIRFGKMEEVILGINVDIGAAFPNPAPNWTPAKLRWPIPQQALDRNPKLKQNTGLED